MRRLFCLTALWVATSTSAFAQSSGPTTPSAPNERLGLSVYYRIGNAANAEANGLVEQLKRALDKSRDIHLLDAPDPEARNPIELEAPTSFTKESDGRVRVTYELAPMRGSSSGRTYDVTCRVNQLERCADSIVSRTERYGREVEAASSPLGLPAGF